MHKGVKGARETPWVDGWRPGATHAPPAELSLADALARWEGSGAAPAARRQLRLATRAHCVAITQLEAASGSYNAGVALAADESEGAPRHGVAVSDALIERDFGCSASEFLAQMTHADEGIHKQAKRKARALQKRFKGLSGVFVLGGGADGATLTLLDAPDAEPSPQKR